MIKKIGIKNFRVFKEHTDFDIKPITLLVGPNNAGKSSFTKLLLLLKNGYKKLDFTKGNHNLEDFSKVISWGSDDDEIRIRLENSIPFLPSNYYMDIYYKDNEISKLSILLDETISLVSLELKDKSTYDEEGFPCPNGQLEFSLDLKKIIDLIYEKEFLIDGKKAFKNQSFSSIKINSDFGEINLSNLEDYYEEYIHLCLADAIAPSDDALLNMRNIALDNTINKLERDYLPYRIYVDGKELDSNYSKSFIEGYTSMMSKLNYSDTHTSPLFSELKSILSKIDDNYQYYIEHYFRSMGIKGDIEIKYSGLGDILFGRKLFVEENQVPSYLFTGNYDNEKPYLEDTFFDLFGSFENGFKDLFKEINYISANRGNQKRVLLNRGESQMDEIVENYSKSGYMNLEYVKKALAIFDIYGEIEVERFQNYASVLYLNQNGKRIAISDLGFGYSQVIPIIMNIVNDTTSTKAKRELAGYPESIYIIEEPEANLHPNLQSKFADFLLLTIEHFKNFQFIIETHSEYLIRKIQYLTASKALSTEQSVIYYFNDNKYVNEKEPKVKRININEHGGLTDTFGPGFYDEATRLQFNLLKVNKSQQN